jgi:hypothetical protein
MSDLEKNDEKNEKIIIRLICGIIGNINFGVPDIIE